MKLKFFNAAKRQSKKSTYMHKMGAVVVKKNKIISTGYNKPTKTHPLSENEFKTVHAELDAILGLSDEEIYGSHVYIFREYKSGEPATAKPCKHCEKLLRKKGVSKVFYTCSETQYKEEQYD